MRSLTIIDPQDTMNIHEGRVFAKSTNYELLFSYHQHFSATIEGNFFALKLQKMDKQKPETTFEAKKYGKICEKEGILVLIEPIKNASHKNTSPKP